MVTSPQLELDAIEHLCATSGVQSIFVDPAHRTRLSGLPERIGVRDIPSYHGLLDAPAAATVRGFARPPSDLAYLRHTSGTSSGLPKPIRQTHWGAVGVLARVPVGRPPATFSTTPLYHGGLADCFRAWASGAAVWFFPEGAAPTTAANVTRAVDHARRVGAETGPIAYFTAVPYVLQMLAETDDGVALLRSMALVGVGGAALPAAVGDGLVARGVRLVSRLGSAECGFLLSSARDYAVDREWQFLRPVGGVVADAAEVGMLAFEPRADGLAELVAGPAWPLRAKMNREDGSYATADLFEPHPLIPGAWRYHSRADAQIALANGKKFDPAPLEGAILAGCAGVLRDVLVFGAGREAAGALLFPISAETSTAAVIESAWPGIQALNETSPSHGRLARSMLVVPSPEECNGLPKSSKGTIMRRQAEERYGDLIEKAYDNGSDQPVANHVSEEDMPAAVVSKFTQVLGRELATDKDLYAQGVDSISCVQVRKLLERELLPQGCVPLPTNIVYDCGTIDALVDYVRELRRSGGRAVLNGHDAELQTMEGLAHQYSDFTAFNPAPRSKEGISVVLTGATGALGAHIVHDLLRDARVRKIYCLLRATTPHAARERVAKALSQRRLVDLSDLDEDAGDGKLVFLPSDLSAADLGLAAADRDSLLRDATVVIHSAWAVNFSLRLASFAPHLAATRNLINLAGAVGARFYFISSTAAVANAAAAKTTTTPVCPIAEVPSTNPAHAAPLGYARSKWVGERICAAAHEQKGPPITVIRVGQLFANQAGVWNASEAYPLLLSTAKFLGCLPDLGDEPLNWLPVDVAAKTVLEMTIGQAEADTCEQNLARQLPVLHVLNPHRTPTWHQMLEMIVEEAGGGAVAMVPPSQWFQRLEESLTEAKSTHSSQGLLELWRPKYSIDSTTKEAVETVRPGYDISRSRAVSKTLRGVQPLDRERLLRMWRWLWSNEGLSL